MERAEIYRKALIHAADSIVKEISNIANTALVHAFFKYDNVSLATLPNGWLDSYVLLFNSVNTQAFKKRESELIEYTNKLAEETSTASGWLEVYLLSLRVGLFNVALWRSVWVRLCTPRPRRCVVR